MSILAFVTNSLAAQVLYRLYSDQVAASTEFLLPLDSDVYLLGETYHATSNSFDYIQAAFEIDFESRMYITHRMNYWGPANTVSDYLSGSNVRSMQMLIAQSLIYIELRRNWRRKQNEPSPAFSRIASLFIDAPDACLSNENIQRGVTQQSERIFSSIYAATEVSPIVITRLWNEECYYADVGVVSFVERDIRLMDITSEINFNPKGVIVLATRSLGTSTFDHKYIPGIMEMFKSPLFQGMVVWDITHSYYVPAISSEFLICMDPSILQPAIVVDSDVGLLFPPAKKPYIISWDRIHPRITFSFVIRSKAEITIFETLLEADHVNDIIQITPEEALEHDKITEELLEAMRIVKASNNPGGSYQFLFSDK